MSKKLEKLKEVNIMLTNILTELETHMFIENIIVDNDRKVDVDKSKVMLDLK